MKVHALILAALLASLVPSGASAATRTWSGAGGNSLWTNPANWQGGVVASPGDRAVFPDTGNTNVTADAAVSLDGMDFTGSAIYLFTGSSIALGGSTPITVNTSGDAAFALPVYVSAQNPTIALTAGGLQLNNGFGNLSFSNGTVQVQAGSGLNGGVYLGNIRESSPISFALSGSVVYFQGSSSFTGPVVNNARVVSAMGPSPFGASEVRMQQGILQFDASDGGSLHSVTLQSPATNDVLYTGSLIGYGGPLSVGDMAVSGYQTINALDAVVIGGQLSGSGTLQLLDAPGYVQLNNTGNSFTGYLEAWGRSTLRFGASNVTNGLTGLNAEVGGTIDLGSTSQTAGGFGCLGTLSLVLGSGTLTITDGFAINSGCQLNLTIPSSLSPVVGTVYPIIVNRTGRAMQRFSNFPDSSIAVIGGVPMTVTYRGGSSGLDLVLVAMPPAPPPPPPSTAAVTEVQNMWWVGPSENGWGMSLIQHDDRLFGAFYIYDAAGNPTWIIMSGGSWDSSHTIFTGPLYEPTGAPYYAYDTTHFLVGNQLGTVTITFQDSNNATLDYNFGVNSGHKVITREVFGANSITGADHTDLWWGGNSQNGWGITITQQGSTLFPIWFTYGTSGAPLWYFMTDGTWNAANDTYTGNMYRATGSPWIGATYDASKLAVTKAGTFSIVFAGSTATFMYTADGHSGTIPLVKEPF